MRKGSNSVSAQISRTARRFSTVIAPQLTKLDHVPALQIHNRLTIRIANIKDLQNAMENYILHNNTIFDPIDFDIMSGDEKTMVLRAQLFAEEFAVFENQKRLFSVTFGNPELGIDGPAVAKIRHPISGMRVYEIVDWGQTGNWQIMSCTEDGSRCQIDAVTSCLRRILAICGCTFVPQWWSVRQRDDLIGEVVPESSMWKENAVTLSWKENTENEMRLLILCFGLLQIIRTGFPQMVHIINDHRERRSHS